MQDLGNKLLIYLAGCSFIWCLGVKDQAIIAVTLSLLLSCLCSFFRDTRICDILVLLFSLFCLIVPGFSPFLPLLIYDATYRREKLLLAAGTPAAIGEGTRSHRIYSTTTPFCSMMLAYRALSPVAMIAYALRASS